MTGQTMPPGDVVALDALLDCATQAIAGRVPAKSGGGGSR
jgi:hypothetical protein